MKPARRVHIHTHRLDTRQDTSPCAASVCSSLCPGHSFRVSIGRIVAAVAGESSDELVKGQSFA